MTAFSVEIHPAAELFPLMGDDDLTALASDIKANGLRQPIVLDGEGRLLDGRNRLAACEQAKVEPVFATVNGSDPVAYVVSLNVKRRNLTASQRAVAAAEATLLRQEKVSYSNRGKIAAEFATNEVYLRQAWTLVTADRDSVPEVRSGSISLADAFQGFEDRRRAITMRETSLDRLRGEHPDLADLVQAEQLGLSEALAAGRTRDAEIQEERRSRTRDLVTLAGSAPAHHAERYAEMYDPAHDPAGAVSAAALRSASEFAAAVADALEGGQQ